MLTDEELRWNRIVDEARFKNNPPTGTNVVVATRFSLKNGYSDGETLAETVGSYRVEGAHGFSATEVKTKSGTFLKPATGYFLERLVDGEWTDRAWHNGTEYLYDSAAEAGAVYRIIWGDSFRDGLIMMIRGN